MRNLLKLLVLLILPTTMACDYINEPELTATEKSFEKSKKLGIHKFSSKSEFNELIKRYKDKGSAIVTRSDEDSDTIIDLFTPIGVLDKFLDEDNMEIILPTISREMMIENGDLTLYEALGYDTLVPDTAFAKLLNIDGMVQVEDIVYKISDKGTYFFPDTLLEEFIGTYELLDSIPNEFGLDSIMTLPGGFRRYNTYSDEDEHYNEADELPDTLYSFPTINLPNPLLNQSFASEVNWSQLPVYNADASTIAGKIWQKLFGRNKSYYYKISSKRRVRTKFYYYNYIVYTCTGALVQLQKKNWIGWSKTNADKLTLNWHNIVLEYEYPSPKAPYPTASPFMISEQNASIPSLNYPGVSTSILGIDISQEEIMNAISKSAKALFNLLKSKIGSDVPQNSRSYVLYGPRKIIVIIPDGYTDKINEPEINQKFDENWSFVVTINASQTTSSWQEFVRSISIKKVDSPKLLNGEIRAAACVGDTWGGTITRKN